MKKKHGNAKDYTGKKFNFLIGLRSGPKKGTRYAWFWKCIACRRVKLLASASVVSGETKSCGCVRYKLSSRSHIKHGHCSGNKDSSEYMIWRSMKSRCLRKKDQNYKSYGGRGIGVSIRWKNSFMNFLKDMGPRPSKLHSLNRINNNKGYTKRNTEWTTRDVQASNMRSNRYISFKGKTKTISQWARAIGCGRHSILYRINRGWSVEKALTLPFSKSNRIMPLNTWTTSTSSSPSRTAPSRPRNSRPTRRRLSTAVSGAGSKARGSVPCSRGRNRGWSPSTKTTMAYIILPEPGSQYGPCVPVCKHTDCQLTRQQSELICPHCGKPLGYNKPITSSPFRAEKLSHLSCVEEDAAANSLHS